MNKYSLRSTKMHEEYNIFAMNPTRPRPWLPSPCHKLKLVMWFQKLKTPMSFSAFYIFGTVLFGITLGKHARKKTHLHLLNLHELEGVDKRVK